MYLRLVSTQIVQTSRDKTQYQILIKLCTYYVVRITDTAYCTNYDFSDFSFVFNAFSLQTKSHSISQLLSVGLGLMTFFRSYPNRFLLARPWVEISKQFSGFRCSKGSLKDFGYPKKHLIIFSKGGEQSVLVTTFCIDAYLFCPSIGKKKQCFISTRTLLRVLSFSMPVSDKNGGRRHSDKQHRFLENKIYLKAVVALLRR